MRFLVGNWKRKLEMENKNGQNLMQMNARVKPLINDHLLKTISVQRPPFNKDFIYILTSEELFSESLCLLQVV